jgi:hypothetical protein
MMLVAIVLVVVTAVAMGIGTRRQRGALTADTERLVRAGAAEGIRQAPDDQALANLPSQVARYLRLAVPLRKEIQEVRFAQTGTLRTDATSERWMAFEAQHLAVPAATGFLWNARVQVAPLLHVRVRDALIDGIGSGQSDVGLYCECGDWRSRDEVRLAASKSGGVVPDCLTAKLPASMDSH